MRCVSPRVLVTALALPLASFCVTACGHDSPAAPASVAPPPVTPPSVPATPPVRHAASMRLQVDAIESFVGETPVITALAWDSAGVPVSTADAHVSLSNPAIAVLAETTLVNVVDAAGRHWQEMQLRLRLTSSGTDTVHASLDAASWDLPITVHSDPTVLSSLAVDSFTVVEVRYCGNCTFVQYPLLKLRNSGPNPASVLAVMFTLGDRSTGSCRGELSYAPGTTAHVNGHPNNIDEEMIYLASDSSRLGTTVTAQALVRESNGSYSKVVATTSVTALAQPLPPGTTQWACP